MVELVVGEVGAWSKSRGSAEERQRLGENRVAEGVNICKYDVKGEWTAQHSWRCLYLDSEFWVIVD